MNLPKNYLLQMKSLLKDDFNNFIDSYNKDSFSALRINTLKISDDDFFKISGLNLKKVSWAKDSFYFNKDDKLGKSVFHQMGLYYIQEPSAMAVCSYLDVKENDKILDLCAAPGGKSTCIASLLKDTGILISNECNENRAKILSQNIERMGIKNCIVTNEMPNRLSQFFVNYFDKVLVDAPCSGEGMFRKDENAINEWSMQNVIMCQNRQLEILDSADIMLNNDGRLVYSTCTFSLEENESVISKFLEKHSNYELLNVPKFENFSDGFNINNNDKLNYTIRLFPHKIDGEGHFIAVLHKIGEKLDSRTWRARSNVFIKDVKPYFDFINENKIKLDNDRLLYRFNDYFYLLPKNCPCFDNIKVLRVGVLLGELKEKRFEPSYSLALSLKDNEFNNTKLISLDDVLKYYNGETITIEADKGWVLLLYKGYPIGFGKASDNVIKNHFPKALRNIKIEG
jgi:NOL1/NOP2/sun family putative RNA methylase